MSAERAESSAYVSIGEVLSQLRPEFPDTTISKLRFLESEGLVEPERTAAGYRKYSTEDIARLRYVLTAQRDHYLPLKVIREQLDDIDNGVMPNVTFGPAAHVHEMDSPPRLLRALEPLSDSDGQYESDRRDLPISEQVARSELRRYADIDEELLTLLEQYGLVVADEDGYFHAYDVEVALAAGGLAGFGIEPRHLRAFRGAADREVGLFKQVITPLAAHHNARSSQRPEVDPARDAATQLAALSMQLHAALMRAAMRRAL
ncbi:MAG TPA: MerR family transcriptional regulator [Mycobacteriales bacterium]|nr:MerR family transcriptional regulator [Mycobacteriales bacterium]